MTTFLFGVSLVNESMDVNHGAFSLQEKILYFLFLISLSWRKVKRSIRSNEAIYFLGYLMLYQKN